MRKKVTIKTIAKELGVATSTVSKALRDSHEISQETKERIKAYAAHYNYKPNHLALQLRNQRTKVIGVLLPKIVHHFFSTVVKGIQEGANDKGYNIMVSFTDEQYKSEVDILKVMSNGSVDGIILSVANETFKKKDFKHLEELEREEVPMVMFDRVLDSIACDKVIVDDISAGYKATNHLVKKGRKRIAMLSTPDHVHIGKLRQEGYERALLHNGIVVDKDLIFKIDEKQDVTQQIVQCFEHQIDAIFAVNEIYAALAIRVAKEKGYQVPKDIAVLGFTDGLISEFSTPSITAIVQHGYIMGKQAVEMLIERIENEEEVLQPRTKVISSNLKERDST